MTRMLSEKKEQRGTEILVPADLYAAKASERESERERLLTFR